MTRITQNAEGYDPGVSTRPQPPRPEFSVTPLRTADTPGPRVGATVSAWGLSFVVFAGLLGAVYLDRESVRDALEQSLRSANPGTTAASIADTVALTLAGFAAAGLLLVAVAAVFLELLRRGRPWARPALAVVSVATVVTAVAARSVLADAGDATAGVLLWAPLLWAGLTVVGAVATWRR